MSGPPTDRLIELFEQASELPLSERRTFIEEAAEGDTALLQALERMFDADSQPDFLEPGASLRRDLLESGTRRLGPFQLVDTLGSGGMGVVYQAEQDYPRRTVALKVLRRDFQRPSSLERFEREVEVLARLDHPGIARILEAGVDRDAEGLEAPYFAMEFVEGARDLLSWARGRSRSVRIEAFLSACDAVQHGHQQGVIHRDLKPANVLVDCEDQVKVIDFGVARLADSNGDSATRTGEIVGTLRYMAPEQLSARVADTRTDVHALGWMLFELLAECSPYDVEDRSLGEIAATLQERDPKPIASVGRDVPVDLGWIVHKALAKEPERRYATASELAADLRRFCEGRPVEAGPPSWRYEVSKFVRRNRLGVGAAAAVLLALIAGGAATLAAMLEAREEANKFRSVNTLLGSMFQATRLEQGGYDVRAAELLDAASELLDQIEGQPEVVGPLRRTLAESYLSLGLYAESEREVRLALELADFLDARDLGRSYVLFGEALLPQGRFDELDDWLGEAHSGVLGTGAAHEVGLEVIEARLASAMGEPERALAMFESLERAAAADALSDAMLSHATLSDAMRSWIAIGSVDTLTELGRLGDANDRADHWIATLESRPADTTLLTLRRQRATILSKRGRSSEALAEFESLLSESSERFGPEHQRTLGVLSDYAGALVGAGRPMEAVPLLEEVVRVREAREGPDSPAALSARSNLAVALGDIDGERAEEMIRQSWEARRGLLGPNHRRTLMDQQKLALHLREVGRSGEAEQVLRDLVERSRSALKDNDVLLHRNVTELGVQLLESGAFEEAATFLEQGWRGFQRCSGADDVSTLSAGSNYASAVLSCGDWDRAIGVCTEVRSGMQAVLPEDDQRLLIASNNLAAAYSQRGQPNLAAEQFRECLRWATAHLPERHPLRVDASENLAFALATAGRHAEAVEHFEVAIEGAELNTEVSDGRRSAYRLGYARSLAGAQRLQAALAQFDLVIEAEKARLGPDFQDWFDSLERERQAVSEGL